ncbi:aminodeoxychorismate synthase component I [Gordonia jinhuaensis]|uniref:Para-aminobenzoate synthase component I n=1 Tax=Gordonia jinhuaensis TaxID=1517702 RepID=A0A916T291_9ACTN|nr:putative para-aminobenzoate synthase component I [Gordonia jinhuaensis]
MSTGAGFALDAGETIGAGLAPEDALVALSVRARSRGLPGPAAVIGDWFGHTAIIAPSIEIIGGTSLLDRGGVFSFGWWSFPDRVAQSQLPPVGAGATEGVLACRDGVWVYHHVGGAPCPEWVRQSVLGDRPRTGTESWSATWHAPERAPHLEAIIACKEAIAAGEIYQACVCTRFDGRLDGSAVGFFADGVHSHRPRKAAFLHGDWGSIASFSPETYLRTRGRRVTSSPIKGTLPRTADPALLRSSAKDVAENIMIVDLVRNDLGRVAVTGSVAVTELLAVHPAPGVWHLVSTVSARLRDDVSCADLLEASFPPASVTGTPKLRARELLRQWETNPRGVYCGAIGMRTPGGDIDLNVAIRTVAVTPDGRATLGVGGGITIGSDPELEWQECLDKAAATIDLTPLGA